MLFSLIIPVYGVEQYIEKCIASCCMQQDFDSSDYEIIVVNDSTPDNSIELAKKIFDKFPHINYQIINRPNGGLSAARNTGIDHAKGDFIWFIDSDDYIETYSLKRLKEVLDSDPEIDIVSFGYRRIYPSISVDNRPPERLCAIKGRGIDFIDACGFLSAWARVYRREHTRYHRRGLASNKAGDNEFRFTEGILWEDGEFNLRVMTLLENNYCISDVLYNYVARIGSISKAKHNSNLKKTIESDFIKFDMLNNWLKTKDINMQDKKILLRRGVESVIFGMAGIPQLPKDEREQYYNMLAERKREIISAISLLSGVKYSLIGKAINFCPKTFSKLLSFKMKQILKKENDLYNK